MAVVVEDNFDGDGALNGRLPDTAGSNSWAVIDGTWDTLGGLSRITEDTATTRFADIETGTADAVIEIQTHVERVSGLTFRKTDSNNQWFVQLNGAFDGSFELYSRESGVWAVRGSLGGTPIADRGDYEVKCTLNGVDKTIELVGVDSFTVNYSFNDTATVMGLAGMSRGTAFDPTTYDYFKVSDLSTGTDVRLDWTDQSDNEDGFRIRRSTGATEPADWDVVPELDTVGAGVVQYTDPSVPDGDYYYNVRAYNTAGESTDVGTNIESITLPPAAGVVLFDEFTGADDDPLDGRVPAPTQPGSEVWSVNEGNAAAAEINNNRGRFRTGTGAPHQIAIDAGLTDFKFTGVMQLSATGSGQGVGPCWRVLDNANRWIYWLSGTDATLYEVTAGSATPRGGQSVGALQLNTDYAFEILDNGTDITAKITSPVSVENSYSSALYSGQTKVGIRSFGNANYLFDDFKTELP